MNPGYKEREVAYQIGNAEARAILIQKELVPILRQVLDQHQLPHLQHILVTGEQAPESIAEAIAFATLMRRSSPKPPPAVEISGDDLLALPYSSGTTGVPKGAMLTHRNLATNHLQVTTCLRTTCTDVALLFLPLSHIF